MDPCELLRDRDGGRNQALRRAHPEAAPATFGSLAQAAPAPGAQRRVLMHPRKDPARRCLKPGLWPEADRRAWKAAQHQGDVLEGGGSAAGWAPHTRTKIEKGYGRWLTWLTGKGLLDPLASPAERVTPDRLAQYVAELRQLNAPYSVLARGAGALPGHGRH